MTQPTIDDVTFTAMLQAIGASPWRTRGFVLHSALSFAKDHVKGGVAAVRSTLPEPIRAYWQQRFRSLDWYDAWAPALFHRAIAELRGIGFQQQARECGEYACQRDLSSGPHAMLVKLMKPRQMAAYVPRVGQYFLDCFSRVESTRVTDTRFVTLASDAPVLPGLFILELAMAYNAQTVRLVGGKSVSYEIEEMTLLADGRMNVRYAIAWS
jgi:hypothetical protein